MMKINAAIGSSPESFSLQQAMAAVFFTSNQDFQNNVLRFYGKSLPEKARDESAQTSGFVNNM